MPFLVKMQVAKAVTFLRTQILSLMSRVKDSSAPRCAKTKAAWTRVVLVTFMESRAEYPNRQAESGVLLSGLGRWRKALSSLCLSEMGWLTSVLWGLVPGQSWGKHKKQNVRMDSLVPVGVRRGERAVLLSCSWVLEVASCEVTVQTRCWKPVSTPPKFLQK